MSLLVLSCLDDDDDDNDIEINKRGEGRDVG